MDSCEHSSTQGATISNTAPTVKVICESDVSASEEAIDENALIDEDGYTETTNIEGTVDNCVRGKCKS